MIYLAKAVDIQSDCEVSCIYIENTKKAIASISNSYKLTVLNEFNEEVSAYNIKDLFGAYIEYKTGRVSYVVLRTTTKENCLLQNCLSFLEERFVGQTGFRKGDFCKGRAIGHSLGSTAHCLFFDYGVPTLRDILEKTTYWSVDGDILIVHGICYDALYKIKDEPKFYRWLTKLKVLRSGK